MKGEDIGEEKDLMRIGGIEDIRNLKNKRIINMSEEWSIENKEIMREKIWGMKGENWDIKRRMEWDDRKSIKEGMKKKMEKMIMRRRKESIERRNKKEFEMEIGKEIGDIEGGGSIERKMKEKNNDEEGRRRIKINRKELGEKNLEKIVMEDFEENMEGIDDFKDLRKKRILEKEIGKGKKKLKRKIRIDKRKEKLEKRRSKVDLWKREE